jgi:Domain of unknown function (DUF4148)
MMRALIPAAVVVASALAVPSFAFAQSSPLTRAEVRAQLVQLERAGYNPASDHTEYPKNIQAAEARIAQQNDAAGGYGGTSTSGSSESGAARQPANVAPGEGMKSIYFGG